MTYPLWDLNVTVEEFKRVLNSPKDCNFRPFFARLLSRVPFYRVFHDFITPEQFIAHFRQVRRTMATDPLGQGRLPFWEWLYRQLIRPSRN